MFAFFCGARTRFRGGLGILDIRTFRGPHVSFLSPGPFGWPILVALTGVDVNLNCRRLRFLEFLFDGLDTPAPNGSLIPVGVSVGSDRYRLPVAFAEPEPGKLALQYMDELVSDAEGGISPGGRGLADQEQLLEEGLGRCTENLPCRFRDRHPILVLHKTG